MRKIEIALPKGKRLVNEAYGVFKKIGYVSAALENEIIKKEWKQLEFPTDCGRAVFLMVRIADIPQYIDKNWADIGISAYDCYREYELSSQTAAGSMRGDNFASEKLPDLNLCSKSRFCIAGKPAVKDFYNKCKESDERVLTVATANPSIAAKFMASKGIVADIITVAGSAELMPSHGGVDTIFDIVESGRALAENGLVVFEEAMPIQTKILVSKAAFKYDENVVTLVKELQNEFKQKL